MGATWTKPEIEKLVKEKEKIEADIKTSNKELNLSHNKITNEGVKCVAEALIDNQTLLVMNLSNDKITDTGVKYLAEALGSGRNETLAELDLSFNRITDEGVKYLAEAIANNKNLSFINLCHNEITEIGAKFLSDALMKNNTLKKIDISSNLMADTGVKYLSSALENSQSLSSINLSYNQITETGVKYLAEALENNKSLNVLNLSDNQITDKGVFYLAEALVYNQNLIVLNLSDCGVTEIGAKSLAEALEQNKTLFEFDLSSNQITDEGVKDLAEAFYYNKSLCLLNLSLNKITDFGAKLLLAALETNRTLSLSEVNLDWNEITDIILLQINEKLSRNKTKSKILSTNAFSCCNPTIEYGTEISLVDEVYTNANANARPMKSRSKLLCKNKRNSQFTENIATSRDHEHERKDSEQISERSLVEPKPTKASENQYQYQYQNQYQNQYKYESNSNSNSNRLNPNANVALSIPDESEIIKETQFTLIDNNELTLMAGYKTDIEEIEFAKDIKTNKKVVLAKGSNWTVYLAKCRGKNVEVKKILLDEEDNEDMEDMEYLEFLMKELELMFNIKHPNINTLIAYAEDEKYLYIIREYFDFGNLYEKLKSENETEIKNEIKNEIKIENAIKIENETEINEIKNEIKNENMDEFKNETEILKETEIVNEIKIENLYEIKNQIKIEDNYFIATPTLTMKNKIEILRQISSALQYLHELDQPILYTERKTLNALNILMSSETSACLTDFGICKDLKSFYAINYQADEGKVRWMAPEIFMKIQYDLSSDVFSFGIFMWEVLSAKIPYEDIEEDFAVMNFVVGEGRPNFGDLPQETPEELINLMERCWDQNPSERPTMQQVSEALNEICE